MVRFQRSYQASARAMSTMDEMLDVLINRTGRVGLYEHAHHDRDDAAQRPRGPQHALGQRLTKTQAKIASNKEIKRPSDDPYGAAHAMALRQTLGRQRAVPAQRRRTRRAGRTRPRTRWTRSRGSSTRAHKLLSRAPPTPPTPRAQGDRRRDRADHPGHQAERQRQLPRQVHLRRHRDDDAAVRDGRRRHLQRRRRRPGPGAPGRAARDRPRRDDGRSTPSAARSSATAGRPTTASCCDAAQHLDAPARRRRRVLRRRRHRALEAKSTSCSRCAPATARAPTASRPRRPAWTRSSVTVTEQLSSTEDADIAKTIIDFNSQQAAYQAALRAGANIVQASLMDFLR